MACQPASIINTDELAHFRINGWHSFIPGSIPSSSSSSSSAVTRLESSSRAILPKLEKYFDLPDHDPEKSEYACVPGFEVSEDGHTKISNDKQYFACRSSCAIPAAFLDEATDIWSSTASILRTIIDEIASGLASSDNNLSRNEVMSTDLGNTKIALCTSEKNPFVPLLGDCLRLQDQRTTTLLRLFRYRRPTITAEAQVNQSAGALPHVDTGLLTIVIGSSPGLEVFDRLKQEWISIEQVSHGGTDSLSGNESKDSLTITYSLAKL